MKSFTLRDHDEFDLRWPDITTMAHRGLDGGAVVVTLGRERRTVNQNRKLWPMLRDVSEQVVWHGQTLSDETWKKMFLSAFGAAEYVQGIVGELVQVSGSSTLNKQQFQDLIELIYAFGAEHGVEWSGESQDAYSKWRLKE